MKVNLEIPLKLYAVRSKDGKFLRSKGYGGAGKAWIEDLNKAKMWGNISTARAQITWWANHYPKFGIPELVEITVDAITVTDESERVETNIIKQGMALERRRIWELEREVNKAQQAKSTASKDLNKMKSELETLKNKYKKSKS